MMDKDAQRLARGAERFSMASFDAIANLGVPESATWRLTVDSDGTTMVDAKAQGRRVSVIFISKDGRPVAKVARRRGNGHWSVTENASCRDVLAAMEELNA